ncbi:MAG: DNA topoisomerase (ATP-hydrolyzing) subunit A [Gemmataceae bacterium]
MAETIQDASIVQETRRRYLTYALSVITSRALPDIRDGLKPVQRRILYAMYHDLRLYADAKPRKCAKITGDVTGNYHPHSEEAVYDALVRLAQDFVMRFPLIDGHGNFGSIDGDSPAARRYTEARLMAIAETLMSELREETVDMRPNYEGTRDEPVVLPAQYPNLLVNGCSGIAVGMATNIPPHNLNDTIKAAILLIDHPESTTAQVLDKLKGPDFPLGGKLLTDRASLRKIYEEGTGTIKVQGEWKLEKNGKREQIIVTSVPYGVQTDKLTESIGDIIENRKLPQLTDVVNESSEEVGLRLALDIKAGTNPEIVMAYLFKHTQLQDNFAYNLTCLVPGPEDAPQPVKGIGLKEILRHFLDFRYETVKRRFEYQLRQLRRRIHILEGFAIIFNALDEAIQIVRQSDGKQDAAEKLIKRFEIDEEQANAVLDAQLYKIAKMEIKKIREELKEKKAEAARIEKILASEKEMWGVIKGELTELGNRFQQRRRTKLASSDDQLDFDETNYIVRENTNVVITREGWIKRVGRITADEEDGQLKIKTRVREGDEVLAVVPGNTVHSVVFFADDGTAYTLKTTDIPASSGYGEPLSKYIKLGDDVRIIQATTTDPRFVPEEITAPDGAAPGPYVLAVTALGQTLRIPFSGYRTPSTKAGRRYIRLVEKDKVVMACVVTDETGIMVCATSGHVLHFPIEQINIVGSAGKGVLAMKLRDDATCLGGALISKKRDFLKVRTTGGKEKEFRPTKYEPVSRGGRGIEAVKQSGFAEIIPPPIELVDWDNIEELGQNVKRNSAERNGNSQGELF